LADGGADHRLIRTPRAPGAAEILGRRIVSGDLKPGSVLPNLEKLADEFAVSRLSMREAMKLLAGKGLVESRPRRGTVVRPRSEWSRLDPDVLVWQIGNVPNAAFVRSLFEVRSIIEPEAAALAAMRAPEAALIEIERAFAAMAASDSTSPESIKADVAFHQAILRGTGNEFLAAFAPAIETSLAITFGMQRAAHPDQDHFVPRHRAIFDAIKRGDPDGARQAFRTLLSEAESDAMAGIRLARHEELPGREAKAGDV
jgi:DNA-binding FadR family transcriptional regulator